MAVYFRQFTEKAVIPLTAGNLSYHDYLFPQHSLLLTDPCSILKNNNMTMETHSARVMTATLVVKL